MSLPEWLTKEVYEQYEDIRISGQTNMASRSAVESIAFWKGHDALLEIIEAGHYHQLILVHYGAAAKEFGGQDV
jgi:hypothetical protein